MPMQRQSAPLPEPFLAVAPAPWAARGLAAVLVALAALGLGAAVLIEAPETVRAPFTLVPVGGADPLRAPRGGAVAAVQVAEGRTVERGEPAFVLRATSVGAGRAELAALERRAADARDREAIEGERGEGEARADAAEARRLDERLAHLGQRAAQARARLPIQERNSCW